MVHDRLVFLPNPAQGGLDPWVGRRGGAPAQERHHDGGSSEGGGGGRVKLEGEGS